MSGKKVIAVVGATGAQGNGLVRAILADPAGGFAARALTRDVNSAKARELAALGAEVVAADLDDEASVTAAFRGAWGAYCVTFFWDHMSPEKELDQARTLASAAKAAQVSHVLWSSLEDTRKLVPLSDTRMPTLKGKYKVPHLDAKGEADRFFLESGVPATILLTSFYWDNLLHFGMNPKPGPDGTLTFVLPMGDRPLPGIAAEDIGACAYGIFKRSSAFVGATVGIAGEHLTGAEMAATLGRVLGQTVAHVSVPFDTYRSFGFPGADDLGNMFQFKHDFNEAFTAARNVDRSRELHPGLLTFAQWVEKYRDRMPLT